MSTEEQEYNDFMNEETQRVSELELKFSELSE